MTKRKKRKSKDQSTRAMHVKKSRQFNSVYSTNDVCLSNPGGGVKNSFSIDLCMIVRFYANQFFRSLTGDKPFQCTICSKKFALACNLRAHLKTHDDEPQEFCVRCGKDFLTSSDEIKDGICLKCEEEPIHDEEEPEEVAEIRHKKFSHKLLGLSLNAI